MSALRVAYVLRIFPKLSETFIVGELAELRRRGVDVLVLSLLPPREDLRHNLVTEAGLDRVTVYDVDRFEGELRRFEPDLIHAHFATEATGAARELAASTGVPYTFTAHGYDVYRKPPADFADRAASAAALITVSEANASHIMRTFDVRRESLHVIPCGVDLDAFRPNGAHLEPEPPLVLAVARLNPVKNLGCLLEACAWLRDRGISFRCAIVGDGPCRDDLLARWGELDLANVVTFVGPAEQSQVVSWWQRASVAVLSSEREGMPVCLMEAAACGVPAVAPAVGGIPELVEHGVTGLLMAPGDSEALALALRRFLVDASLRDHAGAAARARAEERFSRSHQVDRLVEVWEGVLRAA